MDTKTGDAQLMTSAPSVESAPSAATAAAKCVTNGDVMGFARRGCTDCKGVGEIYGEGVASKLCACALKRFLKAKKSQIRQLPTGELAWRWR